MPFIVRGLTQELADEVLRTGASPGYGHPVHIEVARGTGPCRCCLQPFVMGRDPRALFTYRPGDGASLMAPGPVFIHANGCEAWRGAGFPDALRALPLAFEARAAGSRVTALSAQSGVDAETQIERLFEDPQVQWIQLRHAEAGCHIARIERA